MQGQTVEEGDIEGELVPAAPAGQHLGIAGQQQAGDRQLVRGGLLAQPRPGLPVELRRMADEARALHLRGRDGQGQVRRGRQGGDTLQPVSFVLPVTRAFPEGFQCQHIVPERKAQGNRFQFRMPVQAFEPAHHQVHAVQVGHQQVEADVQADGAARHPGGGHPEQGPFLRGEHLMPHAFPAFQHHSFGSPGIQARRVLHRDGEGRHLGQDALPPVLHDDAAQHVVAADQPVPAGFPAGEVQIVRFQLKIDVAGDVAEHEGACPAHPVGLLHVHEREGLMTGGTVGQDGGQVPVLSPVPVIEQGRDPGGQGIEGRFLEQQAAVHPDAELLFQRLEQVQGQQAVHAHLYEVGIAGQARGVGPQDARHFGADGTHDGIPAVPARAGPFRQYGGFAALSGSGAERSQQGRQPVAVVALGIAEPVHMQHGGPGLVAGKDPFHDGKAFLGREGTDA